MQTQVRNAPDLVKSWGVPLGSSEGALLQTLVQTLLSRRRLLDFPCLWRLLAHSLYERPLQLFCGVRPLRAFFPFPGIAAQGGRAA
jgi:hypothetical protein